MELFYEFYWVECNGKIERLYNEYGAVAIPSKYVTEILKKPIIPIENDIYHYKREFDDEWITKVIYGFNNIEIYKKVIQDIDVSIDSSIMCLMKIHHMDELNESLNISNLKQNKIFRSLAFQYDFAYYFIDKWNEGTTTFTPKAKECLIFAKEIIEDGLKRDLLKDEEQIDLYQRCLININALFNTCTFMELHTF